MKTELSEALMEREKHGRFGIAAVLSLALVMVVAGFRYSRSSTSAAELEIGPDEGEYVAGAISLAGGNGNRVNFGGRSFPSQYPLGFPMILAGIYRAFPNNLGAGIYVVYAFALVAVAVAFFIGFILAGTEAGLLAALAMVAQSSISGSARSIMSDIPSMAFGLAVLLLILCGAVRPGIWLLLLASMFAAAATLLRPFNVFLFLPVLYAVSGLSLNRSRKAIVAGIVLGIGAVPIAITLIYNKLTFGEFARDGYKFWMSVPYDYLSLEFSPRYIPLNLQILKERAVACPVFLGIAALAYIVWRRGEYAEKKWRELPHFLFLALAPMTLAYGFYFFLAHRMHLTSIACACICAAGVGTALAKRALPTYVQKTVIGGIAIILIAASIYGRLTTKDPALKVAVASGIARNVPSNSLVIGTLDPIYFSLAANPGGGRAYLPLSRAEAITNLIMTPHRIPVLIPPPISATDLACMGLINGGAKRLFEKTAAENPGEVQSALASGKRVFLDLSAPIPGDTAGEQLMTHYNANLIEPKTQLYELVLPEEQERKNLARPGN